MDERLCQEINEQFTKQSNNLIDNNYLKRTSSLELGKRGGDVVLLYVRSVYPEPSVCFMEEPSKRSGRVELCYVVLTPNNTTISLMGT